LGTVIPLRTGPLPAIDPQQTFTTSFPFPQLGSIGVLSTFTAAGTGTVCSDWSTIPTGNLTSDKLPAVDQIREMIQRALMRPRKP
jgi:hypothetical protein